MGASLDELLQDGRVTLVWLPGKQQKYSSENEFGGATTDEMHPIRWDYSWT